MGNTFKRNLLSQDSSDSPSSAMFAAASERNAWLPMPSMTVGQKAINPFINPVNPGLTTGLTMW